MITYWLLKNVFFGPLFRLLYRPKGQGRENIPTEGPVLLASNHLSFLDSLFIPILVNRPVVFMGKAEYFEKRRTRWFFKMLKVIPVRRESPHGAEEALVTAADVLRGGGVVGIYPEGTRSPDGRLYRGKTGVARLALETSATVVPVVVFGTRDLQPPGRRLPRLTGYVRVVYGRPLRFDRFEGKEHDRFALRSVTDEIMYEIMMMSGQAYVDEYASRVKAGAAEAPSTDAVPGGRPSGGAEGPAHQGGTIEIGGELGGPHPGSMVEERREEGS
jgi:1-acyl-sn-glycerol-3-phosphate acyltransferase